jgi:hypothetical protein
MFAFRKRPSSTSARSGSTAPVCGGPAEQLGVTVGGYVRPDGLNLYAGQALELKGEVGVRHG